MWENSLLALDIYDVCKQALAELGLELSDLADREVDAGLGNGGLGRLAACFLDSMATLGIAAHGYGLRFEYGLFKQMVQDGRQIEVPDNWLGLPNPWEIPRPEYLFKIRFGGWVEHYTDGPYGQARAVWTGGEEVQALPYDLPIPGYKIESVNTLRLWSAKAPEEFNLDCFQHGDYMQAYEKQMTAENITKVLYPNDENFYGKELRLKQEYFMVSASVQDIIRRFKGEAAELMATNPLAAWRTMPDRIAIQLNDTHPSLAVPELMRILVDEEGLEWNEAWVICTKTFAYTNHTVMPEALEEWPVQLFERLLPRHLEIIYLINYFFIDEVKRRFTDH